jgi:hypothetical protein
VLLGAGCKIMAGCGKHVKLVPREASQELLGHLLLRYDVARQNTRRARVK